MHFVKMVCNTHIQGLLVASFVSRLTKNLFTPLNPNPLLRRQALENQVTQVEDVIQRKLTEEEANVEAALDKGVSGMSGAESGKTFIKMSS
jgi:hypothetical protein